MYIKSIASWFLKIKINKKQYTEGALPIKRILFQF